MIDDVGLYDQTVSRDYHSFPQIESFLNSIKNSYPDITKLSSVGKSYENRDIWLLEISDNPGVEEDEPGVFFMGLHHAREWPTVEICIYIIEQLTGLYDSDPAVKDLVDNRRILIMPCVNPDGYIYSHDIGYDWRKNRHVFPDFSTVGVDLNRNYGGSSNGDAEGSWGTISGSVSHNYLSEVYCGPGPISELETNAVKEVFLNYDLCSAITYHTYSELVIWPWGYSTTVQTPDDDYLSQVGYEIATRIGTQEGGGYYTPKQSSELYPTTGDTTDWAYGYYHYVLGKPMFAYTVEACSSFHPSSSFLDQIVEENFEGALYLLDEAENINNIVPRVLPPEIVNIEKESDGRYKISWEEQNPKASAGLFKLEELSGLDLKLDDAEKESDDWIFDGFSCSNIEANSGSYSYYGAKKQGRVSFMKSKYPVLIKDDMKLSFWVNYDTRENFNFAFIEVSNNDRNYEIIDILTGESDGWIKKEYNLENYKGESLYFRFRISGDSYDYGYNGFYFDDINPVADYNSVEVISDDISSNYYVLDDLDNKDYFYRVKGYNIEHGWGDYSCLKIIASGNNGPIKPEEPTGISSGKSGESYDYLVTTTDPEGDDIYFKFDWGDGAESEWFGPYESGATISKSHTWDDEGLYLVRVKAKDIYDSESDWSEPLKISLPKVKNFILFRNLFSRILGFFL